MKQLRIVVTTLLFVFFGVSSFASYDFNEPPPGYHNPIRDESIFFNEEVKCKDDSFEKKEWSYCIHKTKGSTNNDVLFYFHGLWGSENDWMRHESPTKIREYWYNKKLNPPTVVSISFGKIWLLAEKNPSKSSGLYELFRDVIYKRINEKLGYFKGRRILMGMSMGGFNVSQIYLKDPFMFDKYILACPIVVNVSPYADDEEIKRFQKENNAEPIRVWAMIHIAQTYFADDPSWQKASQLKLAPHVLGPFSPEIHLSCGTRDQYGIFNGVSTLKDIAVEKGVSVTWQAIDGVHCQMDEQNIAEFILN